MTYQKWIGDKGEKIAAEYISDRGYEVLDRNYHTRYGEIDLVARDGDDLIFVEVKATDKQGIWPP